MYITNQGNTYIYRRRVPKELKSYINMDEFKRSLVPDLKLAKTLAVKYNDIFNKMLASIILGFTDLTKYLEELGILSGDEELEITPKSKPKPKDDPYKEFLYSKRNIATSSYNEYKQHLELFKVLIPSDIDKLSYKHIDSITETLAKLPRRNIQKYRTMTMKELIKASIPLGDRISIKSQNEYLKTLRALITFSVERRYMDRTITVKLHKNTTSARNQRKALDSKDVQVMMNTEYRDMYKILYYSGMRLSEVYKCKISLIDNIKCFDLSDTSVGLKTESSHRLIPVHSSLAERIEEILGGVVAIKDKTYTRKASELFEDKGKSLYSLRHTFATELASKDVESSVIIELMGHVHNGMTFGRYVKGFPVSQLKLAVDTLEV